MSPSAVVAVQRSASTLRRMSEAPLVSFCHIFRVFQLTFRLRQVLRLLHSRRRTKYVKVKLSTAGTSLLTKSVVSRLSLGATSPSYAWLEPTLPVLLSLAFSAASGRSSLTGMSGCSNLVDSANDFRRVYTALKRDVHNPDFIFNALKNGQRPKETAHDVYCSGCGALTHCRAGGSREGPAPDVVAAGVRYLVCL